MLQKIQVSQFNVNNPIFSNDSIGRYMQEFKRHKLEHSGKTFSHKCPQCPEKTFKHIKDLNRHKRTHDNDTPGYASWTFFRTPVFLTFFFQV
jgi:hypothetical protein